MSCMRSDAVKDKGIPEKSSLKLREESHGTWHCMVIGHGTAWSQEGTSEMRWIVTSDASNTVVGKAMPTPM